MERATFICILLLPLILISCKNNEEEPEPDETCIEGWEPNSSGEGIYFEKCPQNVTECSKIFKIFLNVYGYWNEGPGTLTIRNIENGQVEEFRREQLIYRHRFQIVMTHNRSHNYKHEVTLELPSPKCTINGELYSYTFKVDMECDEYADLKFDICTP